MASRPIVQQKPRGGAGVGGKQKTCKEEGNNNRRALGDIGNFVTVRGVEGKPQQQFNRPVTRSFCAQLLSKGQSTESTGTENNNEKQIAVIDGAVVGKGVAGKPPQKKVTVNPKPETIIEISPDTTEEAKLNKSESRRSSRKKVQTLTSVLTTRSKAACGLTDKPKDPIVNIDAADANDELAAVEYVEDIYKFYKLTESSRRVHDYMDLQTEINEKMRAILVDWLIEVHNKFELMPETLYLTIHVVDQFLSMKIVPKKVLQLVGVCAMLIASKYEEIWAPEVNDFVCITDRAYTREQILAMEKAILGKLEWNLTVPTPYVFLVRFIKASVPDQEMENMVFFLAELGLVNYKTIMYCPSMLAASAVYASRCTLNKSPLWSETLKLHTGFTEPQLMDCAKFLVSLHSRAVENNLGVVYKKYSNPQRKAVALLPPAKNLLA